MAIHHWLSTLRHLVDSSRQYMLFFGHLVITVSFSPKIYLRNFDPLSLSRWILLELSQYQISSMVWQKVYGFLFQSCLTDECSV